jgi:outer membrane protein assembly factor BamB
MPLNPVTAADGKVFVSLDASIKTKDGILFALNAENGDELWSYEFGKVGTLNPPSYAGERVYIQSVQEGWYPGPGPSFLRAFDAGTGELAFESEFEAHQDGYYAPTIYGGTLYMGGGYYGGIYAYNASDGTMIQQTDDYRLPCYLDDTPYDEWTPAVNDKYVFAYVGNALYAMDRNDINHISFSVDGPDFVPFERHMRLAPVIGEQNDILVIQGFRLISFDVQQPPKIRWELQRIFNGQPSVAKGVVYAIDTGALTAWDEGNGEHLWSWQAPGENVTGSMIVTDTHVLVGTENNTYAIELETHEDVWSYPAAGHLALGNDSLYIASSNGTLTAISITMAASSNEPPDADAGPDQVGWGKFTLDGSNSNDADGEIISYTWQVKRRGAGAREVINLEGESPMLSDLESGFYDVVLTVIDDDGNSDEDTMLLAAAGKCDDPVQPNADFYVKRFKIMKYKRWKYAAVSMNGMIDLPDLNLPDKGEVESEITIKLLGVLSGKSDLVLSKKKKLRVKNKRRYLRIYR